jgi:predicted phosphatase
MINIVPIEKNDISEYINKLSWNIITEDEEMNSLRERLEYLEQQKILREEGIETYNFNLIKNAVAKMNAISISDNGTPDEDTLNFSKRLIDKWDDEDIVDYYKENISKYPQLVVKLASNRLSWKEVSDLVGWLIKHEVKGNSFSPFYAVVKQVMGDGKLYTSIWSDNEEQAIKNYIDKNETSSQNVNLEEISPLYKIDRIEMFNKIYSQKLSFMDAEKDYKEAEEKLKGTILEKYNTFIFDLDGVIFDCFSSKGEGIGAFQTEPPFRLQDENVILDINGHVIQLQTGIRVLLDLLDSANKNLGIVSHSADRNKSLPFGAQPAVMLLKKFGIYKYFNFDIIINPDISKIDYVKADGKTLFIDDEQENIDEVKKNENIDVLNRKKFNEWEDLLTKIY